MAENDFGKRIARALRQLNQFLDMHSRGLLKHHDVTVPQVACLDQLMEKGAMSVAVLSHNVHLSPSTMVGIIDRLEKKKLVKRTRGTKDTGDRRLVFVDITEKGKQFLIQTPHLMHNRLHDQLVLLNKTEQLQIADSLERMVYLLKEDKK